MLDLLTFCGSLNYKQNNAGPDLVSCTPARTHSEAWGGMKRRISMSRVTYDVLLVRSSRDDDIKIFFDCY
jgi:hypothetical protein